MGKEASEFTKKMLSEADRITLKYNVEKRDKYNRILAYVYAESKKRVGGAFEKGISPNRFMNPAGILQTSGKRRTLHKRRRSAFGSVRVTRWMRD